MSLWQLFSTHAALRISVLYATFAGAWIWLSDRALQGLFPDPASQAWLQSVKGSFFVLVTSLLLFFLIRRDVRVREALADKLKLEAVRLSHIMGVNPAVIYSLTTHPKTHGGFMVDYVSPKVEQVTGYSAAVWLATPGLWLARVHPEDRLRVLQAQQQLREEGQLEYEYRFLHADGRCRWIYD